MQAHQISSLIGRGCQRSTHNWWIAFRPNHQCHCVRLELPISSFEMHGLHDLLQDFIQQHFRVTMYGWVLGIIHVILAYLFGLTSMHNQKLFYSTSTCSPRNSVVAQRFKDAFICNPNVTVFLMEHRLSQCKKLVIGGLVHLLILFLIMSSLERTRLQHEMAPNI